MNKFGLIIGLCIAILMAPKAHAAVGDIGIWVDQDGGLTATETFAKIPFEGTGNEVRNDGGYTYNTSTDDVTIADAGNYLILYFMRQDNTNVRIQIQTRVTLNGTALAGSYGYGYSRNNNNDELYARGAALALNVSADDEIAVEWRRDTDNGQVGTVAGVSELMIVRLPDDADAAYGHYGTPDASGLGGTTYADTSGWDVIRETDTSVIELQAGGSDIRLKPTDTNFLIIYGLAIDSHTGNNRTQRIGRAVSGSTGIPQSHSYSYLRDQDTEYGSLYSMFLYRTSNADEDISIQAQRGNAVNDNGAAMMTGANEAGIFVMELPSSAEVFISEDGTGNQVISGGGAITDLNLMRTVDHNDSGSFTQESTSTMQVEQDMDMLATASCQTDRTDEASGTRFTVGARFEIEGTDQTRGQHGTYTRGNQGTHDTFNGSVNPAGIFTVSTNDSVQVETYDDGDNGASDTTTASTCGFGALNLDTLEASEAPSANNSRGWFWLLPTW